MTRLLKAEFPVHGHGGLRLHVSPRGRELWREVLEALCRLQVSEKE